MHTDPNPTLIDPLGWALIGINHEGRVQSMIRFRLLDAAKDAEVGAWIRDQLMSDRELRSASVEEARSLLGQLDPRSIPTRYGLDDPYADGVEAWHTGQSETNNPYPIASVDHLSWNDGFSSCESEEGEVGR